MLTFRSAYQERHSEQHQECSDDRTKPPFGHASEQCLSEERSSDDAECGERDRWPHARKLRRLQRKVNRDARHVDQQRDGRGSSDELPFVDFESQHGGRSNSSLVPDQTAEKSRERPAEPCQCAVEAPSLRMTGDLQSAGQHEQRSEDDLEGAVRRPRVQERAGQSACSARDAEAAYDLPIDIVTESPEAYRRADDVWNGDGGNGKLRACRDRNGRCQQAADAEARDGCDRTATGSGEDDEDVEQISVWRIRVLCRSW